ncbi:MAG: hypothetical protein ACJAVO_001134 [Parvibaculaceae bacterium]|jgi:hypothetical protein
MTLETRARLGLGIAQQSFGVLGRHKWLAVFPFLSLVFTCFFAAVVAFGVFEVAINTDILSAETDFVSSVASQSGAVDSSGAVGNEATPLLSAVGLGVVFALYLFIACIFTFCNVALAACVLNLFHGQATGIGAGLSLAAARLPSILGWSVLVALAGTVLQAIEARGSTLTSVLSLFAGLAWRVATFFVVPIIAAQNTGPVSSVKESVHIMRDVWGETATTNLGVKGVKLLILVIVVGGLALTHFLFGVDGLLLAIPVMAPFVLVAGLFLSAIGTIARTALYYYATERKAPPQFDEAALGDAITLKS